MATKQTLNRQKSAEKVLAACEEHMDAIGVAIGTLYGADAGEAAQLLVRRAAEGLAVKMTAMVEADDVHEAELQDDRGLRAQRDGANEALFDHLVMVREQLTAIGGAQYVADLGIRGRIPEDEVELLRLGKVVCDKLVSIAPPASKIMGYQYEPAAWQGPIADRVGSLADVNHQIVTEREEANTTLIAKREAMDAFDLEFSKAANMASMLLKVAGKTELSKRIRPSSRRPGQTAEVAPAEGVVK